MIRVNNLIKSKKIITPLFEKAESLIQIESDLHLEKKFPRKLNPKKPYLLLAGDIGYPFDVNYKNFILTASYYFNKVFVLSGNHEYDLTNYDKNKGVTDTELKIKDVCSVKNNIYFLQKDTHILCEENNIILAGCTLWSGLPISKNLYHIDHQNWLYNLIEKNPNNNYVIGTHHCPLFECLSKKYHSNTPNYFASDQSELIKKSNVITWIHGHSHLNKNINIYGKWILSNQYGSYIDPLYGYKY